MTTGILGATGYAAAELTRLLAAHPRVDKIILSSTSKEGERIETVYPHFISKCAGNKIDGELLKAAEVIERADIVFAALPTGVSEPFATDCLARNIPFIDFSADFRFAQEDEAVYTAWYGGVYQNKEAHRHAVYGLPELNRAAIQKQAATGRVVIGNPGCYPTASTLGLYPALMRGIVGEGTIIADCASGVTGGGRETKREYHFSEAADTFTPYKVGAHRHTPEIGRNIRQIEKAVGAAAGAARHNLIFTPHLAPMNRGILATLYVPLDGARFPLESAEGGGIPLPPSNETEERAAEIRHVYEAFYQDEPFVRVLPHGMTAATARVRASNFCDISVHLDQTGTTLIICAAIDNMVKGAAGQAVQNMNLILDYPETEGLTAVPAVF
ncbi:MAG: N-acetyl-gamma-glutamyl-phosphate reductase [Spirochaetaceae bacterium]|jgi:N-acetyl-gamma-glutamyl-phosphate reductase|nr:N-acetyl-gamma-glutamyl-phosphate reductase [Spirochaetaceae bacterium]